MGMLIANNQHLHFKETPDQPCQELRSLAQQNPREKNYGDK